MELGRGQQRQVVSAVGDGGAEQSQTVPQAGGGQVGAQDHRPDQHRQRVGELQQRGKTHTWLMAGRILMSTVTRRQSQSSSHIKHKRQTKAPAASVNVNTRSSSRNRAYITP